MGTVWYDTVATLGWLAALTTRTHLLSHVLVLAERHPLRAAKELSTLDALSGGRLIVGVGAGTCQRSTNCSPGSSRRADGTRRGHRCIGRAFTDEFPELPGPRFPARGMGIAPRPVRQPRPPIWVGGSSPAALRRAASYGDGWLPRGRVAVIFPNRSPACGPGATSDAMAHPSTSHHAEPIHLSAGAPGWDLPGYVHRAAPRRSPRRSASWWQWESTTSRSASRPGPPPSSASRRRRSAPTSVHSLCVNRAGRAGGAAEA